MRTYIALFRGINVVGNNPLPMRDLVRILEHIGYKDVETYIRSGKSQPKKLAKEISSRIFKDHGFKPKVLLLSASELEAAIKNNPYSTKVGSALHFMFLESKPRKPDLARLMAVKTKPEQFKLDNKVIYLYAPEGAGRSKLVARIEPCLGVPVTGRNWNTVNKLREMLSKRERGQSR